LHESLDGMADVAEARAGTHRLDAAPHGLEAGFREALRVRGGLAHEVHAAGIAVKTVTNHGHVYVDDIARLEALVVRDAVADHVIHRGTDGLRKAAVIQIRRHRFLHAHDVVVADAVELIRGHPRHHVLGDHVEHVGGEAPGNAHLFLLFGGFDGHVHGVSIHGIKRGLFWQLTHTRIAKPVGWVSSPWMRIAAGMRGGSTQTGDSPCPACPCDRCWKRASILDIRPASGTRRWRSSSSASVTRSTSSISRRRNRSTRRRLSSSGAWSPTAEIG